MNVSILVSKENCSYQLTIVMNVKQGIVNIELLSFPPKLNQFVRVILDSLVVTKYVISFRHLKFLKMACEAYCYFLGNPRVSETFYEETQ